MTRNKNFKSLVRTRMDETGENYTTARAHLLRSADTAAPRLQPSPLSDSDQSFRLKTLRTFMPDGHLGSIPAKRRALVVILIEILRVFEKERTYTEKQVNELLHNFHPDHALLRRELIDYGYLDRRSSTGEYWVRTDRPPRSGSLAQEASAFDSLAP